MALIAASKNNSICFLAECLDNIKLHFAPLACAYFSEGLSICHLCHIPAYK